VDNPPASEEQPHVEPSSAERYRRPSGAWTALVLGIIGLVLVLIFIVQNQQTVEISYIFFRGSLPLAVALLFAAIVGALIVLAWAVAVWLRGGSRRAGKTK
jgi:lipopolysaccharide assembly protein A